MLREKLRNRKGFTLIEIIVVIVILAVLMAVAVPSVMSYMNEGSKARYDTVARAVLVRSQTEYAKAVANGNSAGDAKTAAIEAVNNATFTGANVNVSAINLTGSDHDSAEDRDVSSVVMNIGLDDKDASSGKQVTITANKKVEVS